MEKNTLEQKRKKAIKWWQYLLVIPVMLAVDFLAVYAVGLVDTFIAEGEPGHPATTFFVVVEIFCGILTVVLTVLAVVFCVRTIIRSREGGDAAMPVHQPNRLPGNKKAVWRCFIPLMVEVPLASAAVLAYGSYEINSFYNDPNHIGFAIPIVTFLLAGICLLLTVVVGIICIIAAVVRYRKNSKLQNQPDVPQ